MVDRYSSARASFKPCGMGCNNTPRNSSGSRNELNNNWNNDCKKMLEKLRELDFSIVDTVLYLDAYPHSCEALEYYKKLKVERAELVKALAENCGKPITYFDNYGDTWSWTDAPWPWEHGAN